MHKFIHTLDTIHWDWYLKEELKRKMLDWDILTSHFYSDFSFDDTDVKISEALKSIKRVLFPSGKNMEECRRYGNFVYQYDSSFHEVVAYGKINREPNDDRGVETLVFYRI